MLASGSLRAYTAHLARNPFTSSAFAQETRYPHEIDTGLKSLATCEPRAALTCGVAVVRSHAPLTCSVADVALARAADLQRFRACSVSALAALPLQLSHAATRAETP